MAVAAWLTDSGCLMITQKLFDMDSLAAAKELTALVNKSKGSEQDYLAVWPEVRSRLLAQTVPARLRAIEKKLERKKAGLVRELDAVVDTLRHSPKVLNPNPWMELEDWKLVQEYLYLRHSNDVLGRGNGISWSAFDRQFGGSTFRSGCSFEIEVNCSRCGRGTKGRVSTLASDLASEDWTGLDVRCESCRHIGFAGHRYSSRDEVCRCSSCLRRYKEAGEAVHRDGTRILNRLAKELQTMCREEIQLSMQRPATSEVSAEGQSFLARMYEQPGTKLFDAVKDLMAPSKQMEHPFYRRNRMHELAHRLRADGILDVTTECPGLTDRDEALFQAVTIPWFYQSEEDFQKQYEKNVGLYHQVLTGANDAESFLTWRKAVEELGLVSGHIFGLPVDFTWSILDKPGDQSNMPRAEELHLYACVPWGSLKRRPDIDASLHRVVKLKTSLFRSQVSELMQEMRATGAAAMAMELRAELVRDWPIAAAALADIKNAIQGRSKKRLGEQFRYNGALPVLASVLYFELSREAIGSPAGMNLKEISGQFGLASTPFRKYVRPAHMSFPCPCCGSQGKAFDLVLSPDETMKGSFACALCGHSAQSDGLNLMSCECPVCSAERNAALTAVAQSADSIVHWAIEELESATSKIVAQKSSEQFDRRKNFGLGDEIWEAYSSLRHSGRTVLTALGTLVGGTKLDTGNFGYCDYFKAEPAVLEAGVIEGVFKATDPTAPSSEIRKIFLHARLLDWLNELVLNNRLGVELHFDSTAAFTDTLKSGSATEVAAVANALAPGFYYTTSLIVLPVRWRLEENDEMMQKLVEAAERKNIIPRHIYAESENFDRTRYGQPVKLLEFREWPSTDGGTLRPDVLNPAVAPHQSNPEPEREDVVAAAKLLKSLGYLVTPPGRPKN
jgi:hypothetical protein